MERPAPPSEDERNRYFVELPSRPRLIARSSTYRWIATPHEWGAGDLKKPPRDKRLRPVLSHPSLHNQWNEPKSSLRQSIITVVNGIEWTAIDILRIRCCWDFPIVLLISVPPGSASWEKAHSIAMQCKSILVDHDIHDVECEIKEPRIDPKIDRSHSQNQTSATPSSSDFKLTRELDEACEFHDAPAWSECIGTSIGALSSESTSGSKGLYLLLESEGREPRAVALTRRNVVLPQEKVRLNKYRYDAAAGEPTDKVIQIRQGLYKVLNSYSDVEVYFQHYSRMLDRGNKFSNPASRVIGHVLHSPEFNTKTNSDGHELLRDWALVELLPNRHETPLASLKNTAFMGKSSGFIFRQIIERAVVDEDFLVVYPDYEGRTIQLKPRCVPIAELRQSSSSLDSAAERSQSKAVIVAKRGAESELTLGACNPLSSVRRLQRPTESGTVSFTSDELCIIGCSKYQDGGQWLFSVPGDVGSAIWDMEGNVVGLLSATAEYETSLDVSYATPMDWLLRDIVSEGYQVSLP